MNDVASDICLAPQQGTPLRHPGRDTPVLQFPGRRPPPPPLHPLYHGRAVQVDPVKPLLKPPGTKRLKVMCDILLSTSAFKFNLRRYTTLADALRFARAMTSFHTLPVGTT